MIRDYSDHAANERTFLAWLRTSIAVIAFGFVVEKLNLLALTLPSATSLDETRRAQLERLAGPLGRGAGHAFIVKIGGAAWARCRPSVYCGGDSFNRGSTVSLRAHRAAAG
jgi:uncharacterized membrane protein YidH (DUF202 family)